MPRSLSAPPRYSPRDDIEWEYAGWVAETLYLRAIQAPNKFAPISVVMLRHGYTQAQAEREFNMPRGKAIPAPKSGKAAKVSMPDTGPIASKVDKVDGRVRQVGNKVVWLARYDQLEPDAQQWKPGKPVLMMDNVFVQITVEMKGIVEFSDSHVVLNPLGMAMVAQQILNAQLALVTSK